MKKFLILILITLVSVVANAQIFSHKRILDKFDDVLYKCDIKTIIKKNDTSFIIEEKGNQPTVYSIVEYAEYNSMGSKDDIVNLMDNVYGYQECWLVILENNKPQFLLAPIEEINNYYYYIVHRVVTTQYAHRFLSEYYWIQRVENNGRTIYSRHD